ncbi:MAG: ATP-dependent DNA helicase RecG [bacterium]|nr:ATP-dependent DNA helicase RecG [bacterium]
MELNNSLNKIQGIGPLFLAKLHRMGIRSIKNLLFHFPHRYEDFSNIINISKYKLNEINCFKGVISGIENKRTFRKRMNLTYADISDETDSMRIVWFNQPYLANTLKEDEEYLVAGKVVLGPDGLYLSNPAFEKISKKDDQELIHTGRLVPVYPETEGLSSKWFRFILYPLLKEFASKIKDPLPKEIVENNELMPFEKAIWEIHFPKTPELAEKSQKRFSFQELFFIQLLVLQQRIKINHQRAWQIPFDLKIIKEFTESLPFILTGAQKKSIWHILNDLQKPRPMNRLLQGDVGSGKTVVAEAAILMTKKAGFQTILMVPTEVLSKQHFQKIGENLSKFGVNVGLITSKENRITKNREMEKITRKELLEALKSQKIDLIIGTHALIQDNIILNKPALVIVDEQHRFGVEQRARLCQRYGAQAKLFPHLLSMTATPIPRTLTLTIYGDLDLSILDEMPKGRKKIKTEIIPPIRRQEVYKFIRGTVEKGKQVFIICPRIEAPEETEISKLILMDTKSVKKEFERLSKEIFPDLNLVMLHGKMKPKEKEEIMEKFRNKETDILVSTSVIEVGIDIPNATVIAIEGADKFGLAQLHQFRGRVGRSEYQSYCFLFTESRARKTNSRLKAMVDLDDGFKLAEKDLEIRGPGSLFGLKQWGIPDLAMKSLGDIKLVEKTRNQAKELLEKDPTLKNYPLLQLEVKNLKTAVHFE